MARPACVWGADSRTSTATAAAERQLHDSGVSPASGGRAARAEGNDTTVANGAEPPPQKGTILLVPFCSGFSALRARIPHATATAPDRRDRADPHPPAPS